MSLVPWVVPTTDEMLSRRFEGGPTAFGVRWQRMDTIPTGEPYYRGVHTGRQVECMIHCRCQVCSQVLPPGPIAWLFPNAEAWVLDRTEWETVTPPTCEACIVEVTGGDLCPVLRADGYTVIEIESYRFAGAFGQFYQRRPGQAPVVTHSGNWAPGLPGLFMGQQMVVKLTPAKEGTPT